MNFHQIGIKDGKIYLTAKVLCELWDVSAPTITAYKKKGLSETIFTGDKTQYFELAHAENIKLTIKDKHSQSKNIILEDSEIGGAYGKESSVIFDDGRRFYEMDINNPEDLEMIALHPLGEMYLDRVKSAEEIKTKQHSLKVKKGEYLLVSELNESIAETMALVKNLLVSARDQLPIAQVDGLIKDGITTKENKQIAQKIIADEADSLFADIFTDIKNGLMKRTDKSDRETIDFLKDILKEYEQTN